RIKRVIADAREIQRCVVEAVHGRELRAVPPVPAIKICQRNATPLWIFRQLAELHLDMHDHTARLLDLSDAAKIYFRAESSGQRTLYAKITQISAGIDAWQDEKNQRRARQGEQAEYGGDARQ